MTTLLKNHPRASYSSNHYKAAASLIAATVATSASAQTNWIGNVSNDINNAANWSAGVPTAVAGTASVSNQTTFTTAGSAGAGLMLTADLQFGGGFAPTSNGILFNGDGFTIGGSTGTTQLTIGGQGLAINTTNTITLDAPRIRRNASNTFEFLAAGGNLVINGDYSTNITGAGNVTNNIAFSGEQNAANNNNTLTFNGNIVNVFTGVAGSGLGNMSITRAGGGAGNRVVFNNASNTGLTGTVAIGAGTQAHLGGGGTKGNLAGATININGGTFVINQSDTVTQGVEFGSAAIFGAGSLEQRGAGTTVLSASNTFSGGVLVSGGTLSISASERINNVNKLTLAGGNFDVSTFTETLGALDLNGTGGTLTIGSGGTLIFADSSGESWSGTLTITGTFISGSSIGFSNPTGLLSGQLSAISIPGFSDVGLNSFGFLTATAIPEPSSFAALAGLGAVALAGLRRRRRSA